MYYGATSEVQLHYIKYDIELSPRISAILVVHFTWENITVSANLRKAFRRIAQKNVKIQAREIP